MTLMVMRPAKRKRHAISQISPKAYVAVSWIGQKQIRLAEKRIAVCSQLAKRQRFACRPKGKLQAKRRAKRLGTCSPAEDWVLDHGAKGKC
jgi:hypothetical protein